MKITYKTDIRPEIDQIIQVYNSSGINRPTDDSKRIATMYKNSNLVITAWHKEELVGVARALTDFSYCCYLSDLAVKEEFKNKGIGRRLIELTNDRIGDQATLILLAAPAAMGYYPKVGMQKVDNGFMLKRKKWGYNSHLPKRYDPPGL